MAENTSTLGNTADGGADEVMIQSWTRPQAGPKGRQFKPAATKTGEALPIAPIIPLKAGLAKPAHSIRMICRAGIRLLFLAGLLCGISPSAVCAAPSHFAPTIGHAVLCLSQVEPGYHYNYLLQHFGPPYKQEGGAYWFRTPAAFWTVPITEVFVSDQGSTHQFVGALSSLPPDQLATQLTEGAKAGTRFWKRDPQDPYSTYISLTGSIIAFQGTQSKIYCAGYRPRMD